MPKFRKKNREFFNFNCIDEKGLKRYKTNYQNPEETLNEVKKPTFDPFLQTISIKDNKTIIDTNLDECRRDKPTCQFLPL